MTFNSTENQRQETTEVEGNLKDIYFRVKSGWVQLIQEFETDQGLARLSLRIPKNPDELVSGFQANILKRQLAEGYTLTMDTIRALVTDPKSGILNMDIKYRLTLTPKNEVKWLEPIHTNEDIINMLNG